MTKKILLNTKNLVKEFFVNGNKKKRVHAVSGVDIDIYEGETLALVGESGCGKSTLGRLIIGLEEPCCGNVFFEGEDIHTAGKEAKKNIKKNMQMIFQDPYASLNPRMNVEKIISEPLLTYDKDSNRARLRVLQLMDEVGIPREFAGRYPHQFSGGQRQRIGIARAIALKPKLVICDEPVSALDVSIQSQVLNLLKDLQKEYNLTYLFISHDLSVVRFISDRICIMFLGKVCELGETQLIYENPKHPYTKILLDAIPEIEFKTKKRDTDLIIGDMPSPIDVPKGCRFHTRCPYADEICRMEVPELRQVSDRMLACHHPL